MIEMIGQDEPDNSGNWVEIAAVNGNPETFPFYLLKYRVNGIIYYKPTAEFKEVYRKEMVWAQLSD